MEEFKIDGLEGGQTIVWIFWIDSKYSFAKVYNCKLSEPTWPLSVLAMFSKSWRQLLTSFRIAEIVWFWS